MYMYDATPSEVLNISTSCMLHVVTSNRCSLEDPLAVQQREGEYSSLIERTRGNSARCGVFPEKLAPKHVA